MAKGSKLAAKSNEFVGLLESLDTKKIDGFFRKRNLNFWKQLKLVNLMSNATETVNFLKTFKNWIFLQKKMGCPKKTLKFSKIADGNKLAVQFEGISKVSQNVQMLGFGTIQEYFSFSRKTEVFENGKVIKLAVESTEIVTVLKKVKLHAFLK